MSIGSNIRSARKKAGLTQKELGERLGITASAISAFEKDKTNIKNSTLEKIARALDISMLDLVLFDGAVDSNAVAVQQVLDTLEKTMARYRVLEDLFAMKFLDGKEIKVKSIYFDVPENDMKGVFIDNELEYVFSNVEYESLIDEIFTYFKFRISELSDKRAPAEMKKDFKFLYKQE